MPEASLCIAFFCASQMAFAQGPSVTSDSNQAAAEGLSLSLSIEAAQATIDACAANGYKVAVTVIDSANIPKVMMVADGVGPRAVESSTQKAIAANKLKMSTAVALEKAKTDTELKARIASDPTLFLHPGGVFLTAGGKALGAIAASGAPMGGKDDVCLNAGIDKIKDSLK